MGLSPRLASPGSHWDIQEAQAGKKPSGAADSAPEERKVQWPPHWQLWQDHPSTIQIKKCLSPLWHPCLHDYGLGLVPSETSHTNYWLRLLTTLFFRGQNYLSATTILFQLKRETKHHSCSLTAGSASQTGLFLDVTPAHINQMQLKERENSDSI